MWGGDPKHKKEKNKRITDPAERDLLKRVKDALMKEDVTAFRRLIKGGVDVNAKHWFESSLLHEATQMGKVQFVEILLKANADVNACNKNGRTPLHIAARAGNIDIVSILLKHGADVNGKVESQPGSLYSTSMAGQTPLHVALWRGREKVVTLLLESGANVNALDQMPQVSDLGPSWSSCFFCTFGETQRIVFVSVQDLLYFIEPMCMNALDQDGWMAIQWATTLNFVNILKDLIRRGAFIDRPTSKTNRTPLVQSLINSNLDSAKILAVHGANVNSKFEGHSVLKILDKDKDSPVKEKIKLIRLFIDCGLFRGSLSQLTEKFRDSVNSSSNCEFPTTDVSGSTDCEFPTKDDLAPLPLSWQCRICIRNETVKCSNGMSIYPKLLKLPLPKPVLDFLTFSDNCADSYS